MSIGSAKLDAAELERYQRHILLKEIGGAGQQKLCAAKVLIIGMGGLGNPLAQYLAAAGVGHLGLVDDDVVSASNLQRQTLFTPEDIGRDKVAVATQCLAAQNPLITIAPYTTRLAADNAEALIADYDVVADACDNYATRFIVNDACFRQRKVLVSAAVGRFDGQLATFKP
jgi:molybdopterin/thiamine biosynthesis adenylyltransferase